MDFVELWTSTKILNPIRYYIFRVLSKILQEIYANMITSFKLQYLYLNTDKNN